ncbi:hypothetical protein OSTOST_17303 [Ostertagia ostertagi]
MTRIVFSHFAKLVFCHVHPGPTMFLFKSSVAHRQQRRLARRHLDATTSEGYSDRWMRSMCNIFGDHLLEGPMYTSSETNAKTLRPATVPFYATASHLPCAVPPSAVLHLCEEMKDNVYADNTILHVYESIIRIIVRGREDRSPTSAQFVTSSPQQESVNINFLSAGLVSIVSRQYCSVVSYLLQGTPEDTQSDRTGSRSTLHPRHTDPIQSAPSRHSDCIRPPQDLLAEYLTDQSAVENPSQDRSSTSSDYRSHQIVQSLTNAVMFDHTFSIEHLATRDIVMADAFVTHSFYSTLRSWLVEETPSPKAAHLDYAPVKNYSICSIIQSYKGLHAANEKMRQFTNDLAAHPEYWQSVEKLVQLYDEHLTLLHDIQTARSTLTDLILPHILNSIEDNRLFVDTLDYYTITLAQIKLVCTAATTETAFGFLNLKKICSAIARLRSSTSEQPVPAETLDLEDIPTIAEYNAVVSRTQSSTGTATQPASSTQSSANLLLSSARTRPVEPPSRPEDVLASANSSSSATRPSTTDRRSVRTRHRSRSRRSRSPAADSHSRRRPSRSPSRSQAHSSQEELVPPHIRCHFCRENHYSSGCTAVRSLTRRATIAVSQGRCPYCLVAHTPGYCRRQSECCVCDSIDHHPALCPVQLPRRQRHRTQCQRILRQDVRSIQEVLRSQSEALTDRNIVVSSFITSLSVMALTFWGFGF